MFAPASADGHNPYSPLGRLGPVFISIFAACVDLGCLFFVFRLTFFFVSGLAGKRKTCLSRRQFAITAA
jgi:hypothetical protein